MTRIHTFRLGPPPADQGLGALLGWIVAVIVGGFAVLAGFAWIAVKLTRLTGGRRRRPQPAAAPAGVGEGAIIDAHKVGDQWVAYGYDQPTR